jgi:hypothetical protein
MCLDGVTGRADWLDTDSLLAAVRADGGEVTDFSWSCGATKG